MTHWGWYWKLKSKHKAKSLCTRFIEIDSFAMFKNKQGLALVRSSQDRVSFEVPRYQLRAILMPDDSFNVSYVGGSYRIPVEKKPCNYGGFYRFFHCPQCDRRMRKLYLVQGKYLCRKCADLKYYSQRLRPSRRALYMKMKVKDFLKDRAGTLDKKPPWMKMYTLQRLRIKYLKYDEKDFNENNKEVLAWYGAKALPYVHDAYEPPYWLSWAQCIIVPKKVFVYYAM